MSTVARVPGLDDIIGHDATVTRLAEALTSDRLPHGLIFAGPVGVGKRTTAQALAVAFLGGTDDIARRIAGGTHGDFHVVTRQLIRHHDSGGKSKAIDLSVKVIRPELVEPANRASTEGQGKVFIVEEAQTMSTAAQNALLKTLEEPAGRTLIVLLTDQVNALLPTVRSRCQTFRFGELTADETAAVLKRQHVTAEAAQAAFAVAGGAPGRAMQFLDDGVVDNHQALVSQLDAGEPVSDFLTAAADAAAKAELERDPLGSKDAFTRGGYRLWLGLVARHYRHRLADRPTPDLCDRIDAVVRCDRYLSANVNVSLALRQLDLSLTR